MDPNPQPPPLPQRTRERYDRPPDSILDGIAVAMTIMMVGGMAGGLMAFAVSHRSKRSWGWAFLLLPFFLILAAAWSRRDRPPLWKGMLGALLAFISAIAWLVTSHGPK